MFKVALGVVAAAVLGAPAFAQSASFAGARIEAHAGWDRVDAELSAPAGAFSGHEDGVMYGIEAGYDYLWPNSDVTFGLFGAADLADTKRCGAVLGNDRLCGKVKRDLEIGGRIGGRFEQFGQGGLVYVRASYVNGKGKLTYRNAGDPTQNDEGSDTRGGFRLGAGLEVALVSNAYVKAEYRWTDYGRYDEFPGATADFDRHQIIGGVGFRF